MFKDTHERMTAWFITAEKMQSKYLDWNNF